MPTITIYTDGSALGNPGPGGYGCVLISGRFRKELSQGYRLTTNNRMSSRPYAPRSNCSNSTDRTLRSIPIRATSWTP